MGFSPRFETHSHSSCPTLSFPALSLSYRRAPRVSELSPPIIASSFPLRDYLQETATIYYLEFRDFPLLNEETISNFDIELSFDFPAPDSRQNFSLCQNGGERKKGVDDTALYILYLRCSLFEEEITTKAIEEVWP